MWNTAETAEYLKSVTVGGEKQEPETEEAFASFITKRDSTSLEVEDGWYRWQVTIPADVLSERAADQKIGEITGIEVRRRSEGGAAETVLIEGEKDPWKSRESIRSESSSRRKAGRFRKMTEL